MASGGPTLSYNPAPQEQPYYEGLFTAADVRRSGSLGGAEAVQFFARSKLPMDTLKSIWSLADQPVSNSLDRRKFAVAVRLIQLAQNGQRGDGPHLGAPPGVALKPVYFEGVTGVTLQPPPPAASTTAAAPPATPSSPPHAAPQPPSTPNANALQNALQTPPRPQPVAANSSALTVQDPYTLSPQDQARYEAIFPQYQTDGYVQGKQAVALFSKSGLPQPVLREIWNMVDDPVDNRLDKLEFAMAMHLIVCLSKKNLTMPPQLPASLKALKSQQQAAASTAMHPHSPMQHPPPSPSIQRVPTMESHTSVPSTNAMQPPPGVGGMSISDAFEGLDVSGRGGGPSLAGDASWAGAGAGAAGMGSFGAGGPPSMGGGSLGGRGAPPPQSMGSTGGHAFSNPPHAAIETVLPSPSSKSHTSPLTIPDVPSEDVHSRSSRRKSKSRSKSRSRSPSHRSDADSELVKLKTVMQKLQAENISLKAQLGNLEEDEKSVRGEIGEAMSEIGRLSKELTQLRAQVLSAKAKLLEATAELKNAHEKRDAIKDLITETRATKEAIDEAYAGIEDAVEARHHQPQQGQTAPAAAAAAAPAAVNDSFTTDLFGFDAPAEQPAAVGDFGSAAPSQGSGDWSSSLPPPQEQPAAAPPAPEPQPYQPEPQPQPEPAPGHSRRVSEGGFDSEGMGMGAYSVTAPLKPAEATTPMPSSIPEAPTQESVSANTLKNIEELKEQAKAAEELARDAEETRRQLYAQADELRRVADKAEVQAREAKSQADDKKNKGGVFGGKKKKKDQKAVDKAQQEATESRKKFLEIQSQANDAREVATDTKREAEKLRKQVEEAELEAAAAASMAEQQKQQQPPPQNGGYSAQSYSAPASAAPTYGQPPPPPQMQAPSLPQPPPPQMQAPSLPQYGGGQAPSNNSFGQQMGGGFGASNDGYGFAAGVMGSGGGADAFSIPSPTEAGVQNYSMPAAAATTGDDDPFANPF